MSGPGETPSGILRTGSAVFWALVLWLLVVLVLYWSRSQYVDRVRLHLLGGAGEQAGPEATDD